MAQTDERPTDGATPDVELELDDSSMGEINEEEFDLGDLTDDEGSDRIGAQPAPSTPAAPAALPAATAPAGTPEAQPAKPVSEAADQPFTYRADRQPYTIDGSKLTPEGDLVIPAAQLADVTRLLSQGRTHEGSFRQTLQRLTERATQAEQALTAVRNEPNEEVVKAKAINKFWAELLEQGPDAVAAHLDEFQRTRDKIEARIDRDMAKALRAAPPAPQATERSGAAPEITGEKLRPELQVFVEDFRKSVPELAVLTDDDTKDLLDTLGQDAWLERLFFIADEDLPAQGVFRGDVVVDSQVLKQEMARIARVRATAVAATTAAAGADTRNQARLAGRTQGLPPVVTPSGKTAGGEAEKGKKTFKSKAEFDEYYDNLPISDVLSR